MSKLVQDHIARGEARIVAAPAVAKRSQVEGDRNFELPTGLFATTAGCYLAFLGIMFAGFGNPVLVIPMIVFAVSIIAGFGVPAIWVRLRDNASKPLTGEKFAREGIMTNTGRLRPRDAAIQVLILPVLVVLWGITAAIIAAIVA